MTGFFARIDNSKPNNGQAVLRTSGQRLVVLDGWRAVSILLVLIGHLLPLNPFIAGSNETVAAAGMAIFFTLSGFLITRFLYERPEPGSFLVRRIMRIVPLAWAAMLLLYIAQWRTAAPSSLVANLMFYSNLPPMHLLEGGGHLWSLCVEMQFYFGIALLVALGGRRALLALPMLAFAITSLRVSNGVTINIVTWLRLDEILAGAILALAYNGALGERLPRWIGGMSFYLSAAIAIVCTHFIDSPLAYFRPYAIAMMVGSTLWQAPAWLGWLFATRAAGYIAHVSYAVYVVHGMLTSTWLGSGDLLEKYLKRPLLIFVTFAAAHVSTYYFEARFIAFAKKMTAREKPALKAGQDAP